MNSKHIGDRIERDVIDHYNLAESEDGFDASFIGLPVEIKGCKRMHRNGITRHGKEGITKGRFWIDNAAHKLLVKLGGLYIFAVYQTDYFNNLELNMRCITAYQVNKLIIAGDNTKIRYDVLFPELEA